MILCDWSLYPGSDQAEQAGCETDARLTLSTRSLCVLPIRLSLHLSARSGAH